MSGEVKVLLEIAVQESLHLMEQPGLEGISKDHQAQHFMGKGSPNEII